MVKHFVAGLLVCLSILSSVGFSGERGLGRVLIVYYSLSGTTAGIAQKLREKTGADLHVVETMKTYPTTQPRLYQEPREELEQGVLPALRQPPPDISSYDTVLVGGPVWRFTVNTPLRTFLSQADFKGKRVAGFCTHEGDLGNYLGDFARLVNNGMVREGTDFLKPGSMKRGELDQRLDAWLKSLAR